MSFDLNRLYELLPALYRIRDAEIGGQNETGEEIREPLKALLSIIADEIAVVEENLDQLYDDQFIETCAQWAIPYIGQLVGTRSMIAMPDTDFSPRSEVANTIKYRRRKGTASVIEQLARDVTGWDANVVEYFRELATTQYLNHTRLKNIAVSGVRNRLRLDALNGPFDAMKRSIDVRNIETQRGKYNIPNIGVHLWRVKNYSRTQSPPFKLDSRRYLFNPLGYDIPLYNRPVPETTITQLAQRINVPMPISRSEFYQKPEAYYGENKSVLLYLEDQTYVADEEGALKDKICICNLSDILDENGEVLTWANMPEDDRIAIDPQLGRFVLPANLSDLSVKVSYQYGFSSELGGGEYDRAATFLKSVGPSLTISGGASIQKALNDLRETGGVIEIEDNFQYEENLSVQIAEGASIELRAANAKNPILKGNLQIEGGETRGRLILNGLLLCEGNIEVADGAHLELLRIVHCTMPPPQSPQIIVKASKTSIEIEKSIVGSLRVVARAKVLIKDSIIDAASLQSVAYAGLTDEEAGAGLQVYNTTLFGRVHTQLMEIASNCIFIAESTSEAPPVKAERLQEGCVRFSYIPPGSQLPSPYRSQPNTINNAFSLRPAFTSLTYGRPAYAQLSQHCPKEISEGAEDEAEMGAFHHLYQPQRISNLRIRLNEYLRFGLEAGVFYAS